MQHAEVRVAYGYERLVEVALAAEVVEECALRTACLHEDRVDRGRRETVGLNESFGGVKQSGPGPWVPSRAPISPD